MKYSNRSSLFIQESSHLTQMISKYRIPTWILLGFLTFLIYSPTISFDFLQYDDHENILNHPYYQPRALNQISIFWQNSFLNMYIPVSYTLWAFIADIARLFSTSDAALPFPAWPFHLSNVLLHAINAMLFFRILHQLFGRERDAFIGATIFAIHPLQVETVAWITAFRDLTAYSFSLSAITILIDSQASEHRIRKMAIALGLFILALLSKPSAVFVPLALLLIGFFMGNLKDRMVQWSIAVTTSISVIVMLVTRSAQSELLSDINTGFLGRLLTPLDALTFYFFKFILPFRLVPDYGRTPDFVLALDPLEHLAHFLLLSGLLIMLLRMKNRDFLFGAGWWAAGYLPVLGFIPFGFQFYSTVADRYSYIPLIGAGCFCAALVHRFPAKRANTIMSIVFVILACVTMIQSRHWQTTRSLFTHTVRINPDSFLGNISLGEYYGRVEKAYETAQHYYSEAIRIKSNEIESLNELGNVMMELEHYEEALVHFDNALKINPRSWETLNNLANGYFKTARFESALMYANRGLEMNDASWQLHLTVANIQKAAGNLSEAIDHYRQATNLNPESWEVSNNYGNALLDAEQYDSAIGQYSRVLELKQDAWQTKLNMGQAFLLTNRYADARDTFQSALSIKPDLPQAWLNLGFASLKLDDEETAATSFRKASELDPDLLIARLNLINLLSKQGKYDDAKREIQEIRDRNPSIAGENSELMRVYEQLEDLTRSPEQQ